jgi:hypothetical protein
MNQGRQKRPLFCVESWCINELANAKFSQPNGLSI